LAESLKGNGDPRAVMEVCSPSCGVSVVVTYITHFQILLDTIDSLNSQVKQLQVEAGHLLSSGQVSDRDLRDDGMRNKLRCCH
jgi:hypothetical protein